MNRTIIPSGAWDTHFHIFEPDRCPYASDRHFTPAPAKLGEFQRFKRSLGVDYVCVTHGLSYGSDCTSLLNYLIYFRGQARGICVLDVETTTDDLLDTYHAAGVRSVRLDFFKHGAMHDLERQVSLIESTATAVTCKSFATSSHSLAACPYRSSVSNSSGTRTLEFAVTATVPLYGAIPPSSLKRVTIGIAQ